MKNMLIYATMMLLMLSMVSAIDASQLSATLTRYDPQPAEPGKYVNVFIKLENTGVGTAKNLVLELVPEYPFSLDPGKPNTKNIGSLGGDNFYIAEFTLKVDENAVEGTNYLKIRYNLDENQEYWAEDKIEINVQTQDSVLSIENITTEPDQIAPGSTGKIILDVSNMADSPLSNIKIKLDLTASTTPFAPHNSATEKNIYLLNKGETKTVSFEIIAYPDATAQIYKVPLNISYYDNTGTQYLKEELVGIIVNSEPEIQVVIDSTELYSEKTAGGVVLKIINKGLNDVKFMNLKVVETDDFEVLSASKEEYIGNLDSDDFETVEFDFFLKNNKDITIPIKLDYKDNNNKEYHKDLNLNLKIYSSEKLGNGNGGYGWIVVAVIVLLAGLFFYRYRRNKKKKLAD